MDFPTNITFDDSDVERASTRDMLSPGWYAFVIKDHKKDTTHENHHLRSKFSLAPLKDPTDDNTESTPRAFHSIIYPFKNDSQEGHAPPNTLGIAASFLRAILGEDDVPYFPRRIDGQLTYRGEPIDKKQEEACRKEATKIQMNALLAIATGDDDALVGAVFFGLVVHKGEYANIKVVRGEPPTDAELVDPDNFRYTPTLENAPKVDEKTEEAPASNRRRRNA